MSELYHQLMRAMDDTSAIDIWCHLHDAEMQSNINLETIFASAHPGWARRPLSDWTIDASETLPAIRATSTFRWLEKSIQRIYEIDEELTVDRLDAFADRMREVRSGHNDFLGHAIEEVCRFDPAVLDAWWEPGGCNERFDLFRPIYRVNMHLECHHTSMDDADGVNPWLRTGTDWDSVDDLGDWLTELIRRLRPIGGAGVSLALRPELPLTFRGGKRKRAGAAYGEKPKDVKPKERRAFADYLLQRVCEACGESGMPLLIDSNFESDPRFGVPALTGIIEYFPETPFVLRAGGWPWTSQAASLATRFDNVWIDMGPLPKLSNARAIETLEELLDCGASARRIVWGSAAQTVEDALASLMAWKHSIAAALNDRHHSGFLPWKDAFTLAFDLLRDNARRLYQFADATDGRLLERK